MPQSEPYTPQLADDELAAELDPHGELPAGFVTNMSDWQRRRMEALVIKGRELQLWCHGLGPKPQGVIVCGVSKSRGLAP